MRINSQCRWIPIFACVIGLTGCGGPAIVLLPGRPLHIQGKTIRAEVNSEKNTNWAKGQRPDSSRLDEPTREALEALWLQDARGEHASIPAFSRISWQLVAIGAPPELLEWAHKAALEEIQHTQLCFAMAEGYGRRSYSVQPIPDMLEGGLDLKNDPIKVIATETIFDGCLMEGFIANLAATATIQCEEPAALAALKQIAREEASHAAFSWALLEWLLEEHPSVVKNVIQNASFELTSYHRPKAVNNEQKRLVARANPELLIKHGRLPDEQWQRIWDDHLANVHQELQLLLLKNSAHCKRLPNSQSAAF